MIVNKKMGGRYNNYKIDEKRLTFFRFYHIVIV